MESASREAEELVTMCLQALGRHRKPKELVGYLGVHPEHPVLNRSQTHENS